VRETVEREADRTTAGLEANLFYSLGGGMRVVRPCASPRIPELEQQSFL
jgi:hypothetical protein